MTNAPPETAPAPATPPRPSLAHRIEYRALVVADALLRLLPVDAGSALMGRFWRWFGPLNRRHARADKNLAAAMPELSPAARRRILAGMWDNLGRVAAETLQIRRILASPGRLVVAIDPSVLAAIRPDRGAVFVSMHSGNWELVAAAIPDLGLEAAAVYRRVKNPLTEEFLLQRRRGLYPAGLLPRSHSAGLRLASLARRGAGIAMLGDLRDRRGAVIDVFGRPSYVSVAPVALARRLDLPLIAARIVRLEGVRFRIEAELVDLPHTDDAEADVLAGTRLVNARFETWIREQPAQWMWILRRWLD